MPTFNQIIDAATYGNQYPVNQMKLDIEANAQAIIDLVESIIMAASDETTLLTTGTAKVTFRMPYAFTLTGIRASVSAAPTGGPLTADVNKNGTTLMTTNKLTIDNGGKTTVTATTPPVLTTTVIADDDEMTVDIDLVGATTAGAGLKVTLIGTKTPPP